MKKFLAFVLAALMFVSACGKKEETPAVEQKPEVKIGVITSLSGQFAEEGQNARDAIKLALEDAAPQNLKIKLIVEDYGYQSSKAAMIANKLINIDKVDALISWSSVAGNVVAPIADTHKLVNISISNDRNIAKGKYNFIHWTQSEALADKYLEVMKTKNVHSIVMFAAYQPSLQQTTDIVERKLKERGIEVERVNFSLDNKDFNLVIDKMKQKNFDLWYIAGLPPSLDIFVKTFAQKDVDKPLFAIDSYTFLKDKNLVEGQEFVTVPEGDPELLVRLTEKNGSTNYFSVGYSYDVGNILFKTYDDLTAKLGRIPSADEVSEEILQLKNYSGAVGKLQITDDGVILSSAVLKKIINSKVITVED